MINLMLAAALAVSSQVSDVTVYRDRALVARVAEVELEQGHNTVVFENLPEAVDSRGIQVDGLGDALVLDVRFKSENFVEVPEEEWKVLYDRQAKLEEDEQLLQQRLARFQQAKRFLAEISAKVTHRAEKEGALALEPDGWEKMLNLQVERNVEYDQGLHETNLELKQLRKALEQVRAEIRDAGADTRKQRRVVEVDLEAEKAGNAKLRLSYIVRGPRWIPTYDIRVDTTTRQMELNYFALVRQNTGEDWKDVQLKLSTARPGLGGQHPELDPWRIRIREPESYGRMKKLSSADVEWSADSMMNRFPLKAGYAEGLGDLAAASMETRTTEVAQQGASAVFAVKGISTVDSDNVEHRVAVSSIDLPTNFRYSAVPKVDQHAYLKARAVNGGAYPFLEGKSNIFLDGDYVATSKLELVAPGEEFWVFLGADESIKVEHKLIKHYQSKEGFTGRENRHSYEYLMSVKNTHAVAEEMVVWDQLPISGSEGLKVKLIDPRYTKDSDALKIDDEKRIQWFRVLKPGQEWEIPFKFYVEAPAGREIQGLE